jgi:hypothetical protein
MVVFMKKRQLRTLALLVLPLFIFSSCEMAHTRNGFNGIADGSKVPVPMAIASGDTWIMIECLGSLRNKLNECGLSEFERGKIALDMIDLLAVLSGAIVKIGPYLLEDIPPTNFAAPVEFFESADDGTLAQIAEEKLMEFGIYADPSPMQLFWSLLSLILIQDTYPALSFDYVTDLSPSEQIMYDQIVNEAVEQGAVGTNAQFLPLLSHFRSFITSDPNP